MPVPVYCYESDLVQEDNVSTGKKEQRPTIEEILGELDNKFLWRFHNTLNDSFNRILNYIDKYSTSDVPEDINFLLNTYREMADKFYTQYELSLLEEIKKQNDVYLDSQNALEKIKILTSSGEKGLSTTKQLLINSGNNAIAEKQRLINTFPTQLQNALDKLWQERQRINTIAVSSNALAKEDKLAQALGFVVLSAKISFGMTKRIAIVPGDAFSLQFYSYVKNFAVLTVPIYSVQAPWEWSIFWHEIAGDVAHRLKNDTTNEIETIRGKLIDFSDFLQKNKEKRGELIDIVTRNNRQYGGENPEITKNLSNRKNIFSQKYLHDEVFSSSKPDLSDLGSFEHQFERMLANLPTENKFQTYEQIKANGWCVDWFKELFEDAWSILAIREPFLAYFEEILCRHQVTDGIHPPLDVRLKVAEELLKLINEGKVENHPKPEVEKIAAEQILKFVSLLMTASFSIDPNDLESTLVWGELMLLFPDFVGFVIGNYIESRSKEINKIKNVKDDKHYDEFIATMTELKNDDPNNPEANYVEMLGTRDYKQLLELSFFERDFGFGQTGTIVYAVEMVGSNKTISKATLSAPIATYDAGEVSFKIRSTDSDKARLKTTKNQWNQRVSKTNQFS